MQLLQFSGALELGLIYGLVAFAAYLTFRVIDFPDLTVDGSFTLGAALSALLILKGLNPIIASLLAFIGGSLAGVITGYLHVRWRILNLLAGILTMIALYSINLRIMDQPNLSLLDVATVFSRGHSVLIIMIIITGLILISLHNFLSSQFGLALRATGINPQTCRSYGISIATMTMVGLALSNGMVALAGALFAQAQGFADISMGTGTVITGLASVIIGETCMRTRRIQWILISCLLGSILYRLIITVALNSDILGLRVSDLNLITALLVAIMMFAFKPRNKHD
jgi:putative ABC transport system permease protein